MLTLKSNRRFLVYVVLITLIPSCLFTILLGVGLLFVSDINEILSYFIVLLSFTVVFIVILLCIIFTPKSKYIFSQKTITIINKKTTILEVDNIKEMTYYQCKWRYFIILPFVQLHNGGCMKIHIYDANNNKYLLGFFSVKDALTIRKLYPSLMEIK